VTRQPCPVCGGKGYVPAGFYDPERPGQGTETCRSCGGRQSVPVEEARATEAVNPLDLTYDG
jgi:phage/plasmid primase-like uncharacterized protein